jgi:epoxide hydrolase-like predicted phosphatase
MMGQESPIQLIISDFGGVICTFDYRIFCGQLAERIGRNTDDIYATVFGSNLQAEFERGRLTGPEYHRAVMGLFDADVPYAEFFSMYGNIFTEILETCDLLRRLHKRYPLYLLSDTNEIHFEYVRKTVSVVELFDECVVSYKVGVMKPAPGIYQEVLRCSGLPAKACVFIDDRLVNIEGAKQVGMQAILFQSAEQCAADLESLGVVIP